MASYLVVPVKRGANGAAWRSAEIPGLKARPRPDRNRAEGPSQPCLTRCRFSCTCAKGGESAAQSVVQAPLPLSVWILCVCECIIDVNLYCMRLQRVAAGPGDWPGLCVSVYSLVDEGREHRTCFSDRCTGPELTSPGRRMRHRDCKTACSFRSIVVPSMYI
eukprot:scaffold1237_cov243-Pinguiococcus_pyrenoidosus.AAC.26